MMNTQKYAQELIRIANKNHCDANQALDHFLDYLIGVFEVENLIKYELDMVRVFAKAREDNEDYFQLMTAWFKEVTTAMEQGRTLDFFGKTYEETFKGKGKASALGQFYTPETICDLMAEITACEQKDGRVTYNDCACGSGRTMLSAFAKADKSRFNWFDCGDIDYISCKMCALNMMVHGMLGVVKQQDALLQTTPHVIYKVNEIRYPFPTNLYSIRRVYPQETKVQPKEEKPKEPKVQKPVQMTLFDL